MMIESTPPTDVLLLDDRLRAALAQVERLSAPDDRGTGDRTARMAGLALWQAEVERLRGLLAAADEVTRDA